MAETSAEEAQQGTRTGSSEVGSTEAGPTIGPFDDFQRRHPVIGFPVAVVYKFFDDFGGYLAALITYYGFLSIFPLLLLLSTILGWVLDGQPHWQERILDSALSEFPIVGDELRSTGKLGGGPVGFALGAIAALYGGLGVGQALQYAMNTAWMVPRNSRPNPFLSRARGLLMICTAGIAVVGTTALTTVAGRLVTGAWSSLAVDLGSAVLNVGIFALVFIIATPRALSLRDVLPGAIIASILWSLLQSVGVTYVGTVVARASNLNSVFALVFGMLVFFYTSAVIVLLCAELNVVLKHHLWPRALLTPFTDAIVLTEADKRVYEGQAKAQRLKGFERISVVFDRRDPQDQRSGPDADAG